MRGKISAVCVSKERGTKKKDIKKGVLIKDFGLKGDAHSGGGSTSNWHRQVSLLAVESIEKIKKLGLQVGPGDFAENLTVSGIDLLSLPVGTRLKIGSSVLLEVTQVGKVCHDRCNIYKQVGDCVMPREGIFVRVLKGGEVKVGDSIKKYVCSRDTACGVPTSGESRCPSGLPLKQMKVGIITISDRVSRGEAEDISGKKIGELIKKIQGKVVDYKIIPDEKELIEQEIIHMADELKLELIITTGGTGLSDRDVTPEATLSVIEKEVPGIVEIMRTEGFKLTPHSVLSRGVCGMRKKSLIINLPGSAKAVEECLNIILPCLPHAIEIIMGKIVSHEPS